MRHFEHFLTFVVVPNGVGYDTAVFGGYTLGHDQRTLAEKHLEPIAAMVPPDDVPSLRRTLGLFVSSLPFVPDYKIKAQPLTRLTGKVQWVWGDEQQRAFDTIRDAILTRPALYNPDYARRFFVDVDSSDLGGGGCLYQVVDGKDTMKSENKQIIMYVSEPWRGSMIDRPIYYKEARALAIVVLKQMQTNYRMLTSHCEGED